MESTARKTWTEEEYLAFEEASAEKHELINGEVVAMAGGSHAHNTIVANLIRSLGNRLEHRPCIVMSSDQRVYVDETGLYTYPDVTVVCGRPRSAPGSPSSLTNPLMVVEVLSPDTEAYDRGAKFAHYRHLPSLQAYVLVAQNTHRIEHFQRMPSGQWLLTVAEAGELAIPALELSLSVDEVYSKIDLLEPEAG